MVAGIVLCGDDAGQLWMYNLKSLLDRQQPDMDVIAEPSRVSTRHTAPGRMDGWMVDWMDG